MDGPTEQDSLSFAGKAAALILSMFTGEQCEQEYVTDE